MGLIQNFLYPRQERRYSIWILDIRLLWNFLRLKYWATNIAKIFLICRTLHICFMESMICPSTSYARCENRLFRSLRNTLYVCTLPVQQNYICSCILYISNGTVYFWINEFLKPSSLSIAENVQTFIVDIYPSKIFCRPRCMVELAESKFFLYFSFVCTVIELVFFINDTYWLNFLYNSTLLYERFVKRKL